MRERKTVDWMAFAQADFGAGEGGFGYGANDNAYNWADNSNSGYAVLGLAAAEGLGCTVPLWVKTELNIWINYLQNDVNGDPDDGGSGYSLPDSWVNELKTANLLFQMTFYGDAPNVSRFIDAIDYIERHWFDMNIDPGWGYNLSQAHYQAI